jgi:hypothetical protein
LKYVVNPYTASVLDCTINKVKRAISDLDKKDRKMIFLKVDIKNSKNKQRNNRNHHQ